MSELEANISMKREELATRLRLASMTHAARGQGEQLRTAAQLATSRFQGETQMAVAQANSLRNANPANKEPR
jgi:hypothetical protein